MAFALLYERLMRGRDDDERLRADALLGMPGARERLDARRREAVDDFGFEVG